MSRFLAYRSDAGFLVAAVGFGRQTAVFLSRNCSLPSRMTVFSLFESAFYRDKQALSWHFRSVQDKTLHRLASMSS
jgi:hypothetical protein